MSRVESLRFLCRALSPYVSGETLRSELCAADWQAVVALANNYFVVPALWSALERKGLTTELDPPLAGYLEAVYGLNAERNAAIARQLEEAVAALNEAGIEPLLLKGGAALATGLFAAPGVRFMLDLDLWVPEKSTAAAHAALAAFGYHNEQPHGRDLSYAKHEAPLWKEGERVRLELHRRFLSDPAHDAALFQRLQTRDVRLQNGAVAKVLSPGLQALHSLMHSEVCHGGHARRYLDLRQLHNFVTLCHVHEAEIDPRLMDEFMAELGLAPVLRAYRHLAAQLCALPVTEQAAFSERAWLFTVLLPFRFNAARGVMTAVAMMQTIGAGFSRASIERQYPTRNATQLQLNRVRHLGVLVRRYAQPQQLRLRFAALARMCRGWSRPDQ